MFAALSSGAVRVLAFSIVVFPAAIVYGNASPANCLPSESVPYGSRVLLVGFTEIMTSYRDNTQAEPDTQYTDSFLVTSANTFLRYELARRFTPVQPRESVPAAGVGATDSSAPSVVSDEVYYAALADSFKVNLIAVAIACSAGFKVYQPQGWRDNTGPGYTRPVDATGFARVHVQLRNSNGRVVYECVGKGSAGKPLLYGMFNGRRRTQRREEELRSDIVKASQRLFAPPIIRAIGKAARNALAIR